MKLKKIASLMLAGIMAVSMLAGCKGDSSSTPTDSDTEVTPVTGAAAAINAELDGKNGEISFSEGNDLQKLMETYLKNNTVDLTTAQTTAVNVNNATTGIGKDISDSAVALLGVDSLGFNNNPDHILSTGGDKEITNIETYVLSGKLLTLEGALKMVGQHINDLKLVEESSDGKYTYSYAGEVAAAKAESEGKSASAWVVSVTITRSAVKK